MSMRLLIAIPALDEESSIRSIIEQSLDARDHIVQNSPVTEVEITVVSDGSTDRTVEFAKEYEDRIRLIVFSQNRGYGAAITEAWRQSEAELVGFLDADGTCDPRLFAPLCTKLVDENADVVLGCRLNSMSRMPLVRRIGNMFFAAIMSLLSFTRVRDVASGMRVVRRSSLQLLYPLPSTLDFTPAMSARAVFSDDLEIRDLDIPYHERSGESKLHPVADGIRFLRVILRTILLYRPSRPLGLVAVVFLGLATVMMVYPTWFYLNNTSVEETMIYRFLVAELLTTVGALLICAGHLGSKAADISLAQDPGNLRRRGIFNRLLTSPWFWAVPVALVAGGVLLVWDAWMEYITTGEVHMHWSRFVAMMLMFSVTATLLVTKILDYCLDLLAERLDYLRRESPFTDRRAR